MFDYRRPLAAVFAATMLTACLNPEPRPADLPEVASIRMPIARLTTTSYDPANKVIRVGFEVDPKLLDPKACYAANARVKRATSAVLGRGGEIALEVDVFDGWRLYPFFAAFGRVDGTARIYDMAPGSYTIRYGERSDAFTAN